ncbi:MAG: hypothetical protein PWP65_896 [Clostridia bacterium]|nr:hypothetical protein [Clostridia bacterium]
MIASMTGYGRGEAAGAGKLVIVEMKSVNQRFLEVVVRLPRPYLSLEEKVRSFIKEKLNRGHVDVFVSIEEENKEKRQILIDKALVIAYYNALKEIAQNLAIAEDITASRLLGYPGVIQEAMPEWEEESLWPVVASALNEAVAGLLSMRRAEGKKLEADLLARVAKLKNLIEIIRQRAPQVPELFRRRLEENLQPIIQAGTLEPGRLEMEVALLAERCDISEEIVRTESHLSQIRAALQAPGPIGRRLEFLLQEIFREVNTIGAKANDLEISHLVVEIKSELEKIREQIQNIE